MRALEDMTWPCTDEELEFCLAIVRDHIVGSTNVPPHVLKAMDDAVRQANADRVPLGSLEKIIEEAMLNALQGGAV